MSPRAEATKNPEPEQVVDMPKCGVIIRKEPFQEGVRCTEDAADYVQLVNPDDGITVTAVLLLCKRHSEKMDGGKSYILTDGDGNYVLANKGLNPTPPPDTLSKDDTPPTRPSRPRKSAIKKATTKK